MNNKQDLYSKTTSRKMSSNNVALYMIFVDLTKAFDTVSHGGLWKITAKFGRPAPCAQVLSYGLAIFQDGMQACVQNDGE